MSTAASTPCAQSSPSSSVKLRAAQLVHLLVVAAELDGGLDVALGDDRASTRRDHVLGDLGHPARSSGATSSGTAMSGTRSRAILATCTDRSPIRSSSLTIRSAATTIAQVAGDRLLQGEQGEGRVLDPLAARGRSRRRR